MAEKEEKKGKKKAQKKAEQKKEPEKEKHSFSEDMENANLEGRISKIAAQIAEKDKQIKELKQERKDLDETMWELVAQFKKTEEGQQALSRF